VASAASAVLLTVTALSVTVPSAPALAADTATINGATTFQTITGFGASEAFGEASTVMNAASSVQQQALGLLYSPTSGALLGTSGSGGGGNTVTVTSPGNQAGTAGTAASVPIHASDSASGQTLSYAATGLPAGLSINASTGLISGTPTTAGTSTVTVTARDGTGASGSATFGWTISSSGGGGGAACQVVYSTQSQWAGGFVAGLTITNTGSSAINGWTLGFAFPGDQKITTAWNGTATQSGENVTITNAIYNGSIAAGANTSVGFQGTWASSDAVPTAFTLNGASCTT